MKKLTLSTLALSGLLVAPIVTLPLLSVSLATNDNANSNQTAENEQFQNFVNFKSDKLPFAWPVESSGAYEEETYYTQPTPTVVYKLPKQWRSEWNVTAPLTTFVGTVSTSTPKLTYTSNLFNNSRQLEVVKISETQVAATIDGWENIKNIKNFGYEIDQTDRWETLYGIKAGYDEQSRFRYALPTDDSGKVYYYNKTNTYKDDTGTDSEAEKANTTFTIENSNITKTFRGSFPSVISAWQNNANAAMPYNTLPKNEDFQIYRLYVLLDFPSKYEGPTLSLMAEGSVVGRLPKTSQNVESKADRYLPNIHEVLPMLITVNNGAYVNNGIYYWNKKANLEVGFDQDIFKAIDKATEWQKWIDAQLLTVNSITGNWDKQDAIRKALNDHEVDESNWNRIKTKIIWNMDTSNDKLPLSRYWKTPYLINGESVVDYLAKTVTLQIPNPADPSGNNASYQDFTRLELVSNLLKKSDITFSYQTGGQSKTAKLEFPSLSTKIDFASAPNSESKMSLTLNEATFTPKIIPLWSIGNDRDSFTFTPRPLFLDKQTNPFNYDPKTHNYEIKSVAQTSSTTSVTTDPAIIWNNALHH